MGNFAVLLKDESWQVRQTAYLLLQNCDQSRLAQVLQLHNPYQLFECLHRHFTAKFTTYALTISPDGQNLISGGSDKLITVRVQSFKLLPSVLEYGIKYGIKICLIGQLAIS